MKFWLIFYAAISLVYSTELPDLGEYLTSYIIQMQNYSDMYYLPVETLDEYYHRMKQKCRVIFLDKARWDKNHRPQYEENVIDRAIKSGFERCHIFGKRRNHLKYSKDGQYFSTLVKQIRFLDQGCIERQLYATQLQSVDRPDYPDVSAYERIWFLVNDYMFKKMLDWQLDSSQLALAKRYLSGTGKKVKLVIEKPFDLKVYAKPNQDNSECMIEYDTTTAKNITSFLVQAAEFQDKIKINAMVKSRVSISGKCPQSQEARFKFVNPYHEKLFYELMSASYEIAKLTIEHQPDFLGFYEFSNFYRFCVTLMTQRRMPFVALVVLKDESYYMSYMQGLPIMESIEEMKFDNLTAYQLSTPMNNIQRQWLNDQYLSGSRIIFWEFPSAYYVFDDNSYNILLSSRVKRYEVLEIRIEKKYLVRKSRYQKSYFSYFQKLREELEHSFKYQADVVQVYVSWDQS